MFDVEYLSKCLQVNVSNRARLLTLLGPGEAKQRHRH